MLIGGSVPWACCEIPPIGPWVPTPSPNTTSTYPRYHAPLVARADIQIRATFRSSSKSIDERYSVPLVHGVTPCVTTGWSNVCHEMPSWLHAMNRSLPERHDADPTGRAG